jgi:hypothetical protein
MYRQGRDEPGRPTSSFELGGSAVLRVQGVTVGHVRSDRDRGWTKLGGELLQAVHPPPGQQRHTVAVSGKSRAVAAPIPDDAPVITATRPVFCSSINSTSPVLSGYGGWPGVAVQLPAHL